MRARTGLIIGRMALHRRTVERAVCNRLSDRGLDKDDFDIEAIAATFHAAGIEDLDDIRINGGDREDPFVVNSRIGNVIADEWGGDSVPRLRIGIFLNQTWHQIDTINYNSSSPAGIKDSDVAALLSRHGWIITGPWTNDEGWNQQVAPIRKVAKKRSGSLLRIAQYVVRRQLNGATITDNAWAMSALASAIMILLSLFVFAIASNIATNQNCSVMSAMVQTEPTLTIGDRIIGVPGAAIFAGWAYSALAIASRWSADRIVPWTKRLQGTIMTAVGSILMIVGGLAATAILIQSLWTGNCSTSNFSTFWTQVSVGALLSGFALYLIGTMRQHDASVIGFAFVIFSDVFVVYSLILGFILSGSPSTEKLLFVFALIIHAGCMSLATRWAYEVGMNPYADAADCSKAGEAARSLCVFWVLLFASVLFQIVANPPSIGFLGDLRAAVLGALSLGALLTTMGSARTKYAEGKENAVRKRRAASLSRRGIKDIRGNRRRRRQNY